MSKDAKERIHDLIAALVGLFNALVFFYFNVKWVAFLNFAIGVAFLCVYIYGKAKEKKERPKGQKKGR